MRAMSLAADDGEGEQNELRNLQTQLESTNKLVQTLSQQLSELKEQVRAAPNPAYTDSHGAHFNRSKLVTLILRVARFFVLLEYMDRQLELSLQVRLHLCEMPTLHPFLSFGTNYLLHNSFMNLMHERTTMYLAWKYLVICV